MVTARTVRAAMFGRLQTLMVATARVKSDIKVALMPTKSPVNSTLKVLPSSFSRTAAESYASNS